MTALTLEITSDLESALHREAARRGLDAQGYVLDLLREKFSAARQLASAKLPAEEARLLQEINRGLPGATWQRYRALKEKRRAGSLTSEEQAELITVSDQIEEMNVRRMEQIVQLARLRRTTVDRLVKDLGLESPLYE